jgi:hypothetical protein
MQDARLLNSTLQSGGAAAVVPIMHHTITAASSATRHPALDIALTPVDVGSLANETETAR